MQKNKISCRCKEEMQHETTVRCITACGYLHTTAVSRLSMRGMELRTSTTSSQAAHINLTKRPCFKNKKRYLGVAERMPLTETNSYNYGWVPASTDHTSGLPAESPLHELVNIHRFLSSFILIFKFSILPTFCIDLLQFLCHLIYIITVILSADKFRVKEIKS